MNIDASDRDEKARFRRVLSEAVGLSTLPAVWAGYRLPEIVGDVAEVLLRTVHLEFVHVTLVDAAVITATRGKQQAVDTSHIAAEAKRLLASGDTNVATIRDPSDSTRSLRVTVIGGGSESELTIVAASAGRHFPAEADRFLLALTANLANTVISRKRVEELVEENVFLRNQIDERLLMGSVIAVSRSMRSVLSNVGKVGPTDTTVLITGETGTGKELIAREIHRRSRRAGGPLIAVHSAALPVALIASELFGHERGSFTGAMQRRIGRFELASRGTIFLDEVGELPAEMQVA
ncbi:MAG: sigma 54-interacting transcriptional regulator, partial [Thermoanaerobaculia bacterium]